MTMRRQVRWLLFFLAIDVMSGTRAHQELEREELRMQTVRERAQRLEKERESITGPFTTVAPCE